MTQVDKVIDSVHGVFGDHLGVTRTCSKRKWLIYTASCMVSLVDFAIVLTFGSMFVQLLEKFGENRSTTATVQSILLGTASSSCVVSGILVKKFGTARVSFLGSVCLSGGFIFSFFAKSILLLDVFIGVFGGIGVSLLYVSSTVMARNSFEGNARDIAVGAHNFCVGIGSIVYPHVLSALTNTYTVNETFLILGGIFLNNFVISLLICSSGRLSNESLVNSQKETVFLDSVKSETEKKDTEDIDKNATTGSRICVVLDILWKRVVTLMQLRYTLVLVGTGVVMSTSNSYLIVFNDINLWKGFTKDESLLLFTVFSAFSTAARTLPLIFCKLKPDADIMILLAVCAICGCIGQTLILFSTTVAFTLAGNVFAGVTHGGVINAASVAVAKYSSQELFGVAVGLTFTLLGVLTLALGPIYGYIRDSIQSYEVAIILTATMCGIGAMLYSAAPIYEMCRTTTQRQLSVQAHIPSADAINTLTFIPGHTANETASVDSTYM